MSLEATPHQYLAFGNRAPYLFCSPPWVCSWDPHCESPHTACISFQEWGHGNATLSGSCLSSFPSSCHWGCTESAHKSRSPQRLDSSWTRDCLSCSDWIPGGCSQKLGLKHSESLYWGQRSYKQRHLAYRWEYELCGAYELDLACLHLRALKLRGRWFRDVVQMKIKTNQHRWWRPYAHHT